MYIKWAKIGPDYWAGQVNSSAFMDDWVVQLIHLNPTLTRWILRHYGDPKIITYAETCSEAMAIAEAMQAEVPTPQWESKLAGALVDQLLS